MGDYVAQSFVLRNQHRQLHTRVLPRQGAVYPLEITAMPGYAPVAPAALIMLNLAEATPRIKVSSFGLLAVEPLGMASVWVGIGASGVATLPITIPPGSSLHGVTLYFQALIVHGLSPATWHFTNLLTDVIQ